ncbi:WSC domain protein [Mycena sanguinolenta]|uniref:WSC domain protein n=1 Tax=Mycena sanguinolenta TaxID=230812 RepID=A0A8H6Y497_9AGAR|nr:WSC domain protein [Mycena sanguinolenta]
MFRSSFAALVALGCVNVVNAWFRVACTDPLVQERLDPIISPGVVPSQHVHTIHGASNFGPNYTYNSLRASSCTNCEVEQDLSNYWFPKLYFQDPQTKLFEPVDNGGLLVYYQNRGDGDVSNGGPGLKAFPPGFKMITGNPARRSKKYPVGLGTQDELRERAIQWSCLRYSAGQPGYDDNGTGFPTTDCESGFNYVQFTSQLPVRSDPTAVPACWDGVNLDSPDHMNHTAFLSGLDNGSCPEGYPVTLMKAQDCFLSALKFLPLPSDPTGFSWHGDFQNGWDTTALQEAIDDCNNPNDATGSGDTSACQYLTVNTVANANTCKIAPIVNEAINGTLTQLPGCNPLQYGPGDATLYTAANCPI